MSSAGATADGQPRPAKTTVGGYEILSQVGRGGMGAVFKARQVSVGRIVALKILPHHLAKSPAFVTRFLREAQSAARLNHPCIVQAIDAGYADGYYYFAMEFVDGRSLRDVLRSEGPLPERRAFEICRDVARALAAAHEAGIIHRDVKPDNILVTADGAVKLADLGLAREAARTDASVTQVGVALGTPDYISPEQVRGEADLDGRTDLYSLGATMHHMVTGSPPYSGRTHAETMARHLTAPVPNPRRGNPNVSYEAAGIIRKAMAKDRAERYASAAEFIRDVELVLAGQTPAAAIEPAEDVTVVGSMGARGQRAAWWVAGGALAALVAVVVGAVTWPRVRKPPTEPATPLVARPDGAPRPQKSADEALLARAQKWAGEHPGQHRQAIKVYTDAIEKMTDPTVEMKAQAELEDLNAQLAQAGDAAFKTMEARAAGLAGAGDYDGAIAALAALPEDFADVLGETARTARARLTDEAEARVRRSLAEAERLSKEGRPAEALAELDKLNSVRYAARAAQVRALRERLEAEGKDADETARRRALAAAETRLEKVLGDVEAAVGRGALAEALRLADAALRDEALKPVEPALRALHNVCTLLPGIGAKKMAAAVNAFKALEGHSVSLRTREGVRTGKVKRAADDGVVLDKSFVINGQTYEREETVRLADLTDETLAEFRAEWAPQTADEGVAAALLALPARDAGKLDAALKLAEGHPLAPRYAARLAEFRFGAAETAARVAWEAIKPYFEKQGLAKPELDALARLLDEFEQKHGGTRFAASVKDRVALLRAVFRIGPEKAPPDKWPFTSAEARRRQQNAAEALGVAVERTVDLGGDAVFEFVLIPQGEFLMGAEEPFDEVERKCGPLTDSARELLRQEYPRHRVRITRAFYFGKHEVTQQQWQKVMGENPAAFKNPKCPVEQVRWDDCQEFIRKLNALTKGTFRLPTEAEWEYACRAGTDTPFHFGDTISADQANYDGSRTYGGGRKGENRKRTVPVGSFSPNPFGLFDVHGNVWEWCADWFGPYPAEAQTDPKGPDGGKERVLRGGSWETPPYAARSSKRFRAAPTVVDLAVGVRLAADVDALPRDAAADALAAAQRLFKGRVLEFDPKTLHIKLAYDFEDPAQAEDWTPSKWHKGAGFQVRGGALVLSKTRVQALTKARFSSVTVSVDFTASGGSGGATLLACADGRGSHYELCGLWKYKDPPPWRCQIFKYVRGKFPQDEVDKGKWPIKASPFGGTGRGTMSLFCADGRIIGRLGPLTLEVRDNSLTSGSVGVWAFDTDTATFDNVVISGTLDRQWFTNAGQKTESGRKPTD